MATTLLYELSREFDNGGTDNQLSFDGATLELRVGSRDQIAFLTFKPVPAYRFTDEYHMALGWGGIGKLLEHFETGWLKWARDSAEEIYAGKGGNPFRIRHFDIYLESWGRLEVIADDVVLTYEERRR